MFTKASTLPEEIKHRFTSSPFAKEKSFRTLIYSLVFNVHKPESIPTGLQLSRAYKQVT